MSSYFAPMRILPRYDIALNEKHVLNLVELKFDLLERLLQEKNYDGAASVYSTLLGEMKESDGLAFTIGFLLIQLIDRLNNPNAMKNFFRTIISHLVPNKTASRRFNFVILESVLYTLRNGDLVGASFMLEDQMRTDHVYRDPIFQAMSGILAFRKFLSDRNFSFSTWMNWKLDDPDTPANDIDNPDVKTAILHMQKALAAQSSNSTYLYFLCMFLLQDGDERQCLDTCKVFCQNNPDDALGYLIRAKLLKRIDSDVNATEEVKCWRKYIDIDPTSDEAFMALLMHYKQQRVGISVMLRIVMNRIDVVIGVCENLAIWKLFAALVVARERALAAREHQKIGEIVEDREFMTQLYTWKQRYWSPEAWRLQSVDLNTATKITIVLCCMLIFGKTTYTLRAVADLAESSQSDMRFHMAPFGVLPLLEQHIALVARIKQLKKPNFVRNKVRAEHLRVTGAEQARRLLNPSELEAAEIIFNETPAAVSERRVTTEGVVPSFNNEEAEAANDVDLLRESGRHRKRQRELTFYDDDAEPEAPLKQSKLSEDV